MTYTIKLENARQMSTLLDALNAQEIVLDRAMEHLTGRAARQTITEEVERVQALRKVLLGTNADSRPGSDICAKAGGCCAPVKS